MYTDSPSPTAVVVEEVLSYGTHKQYQTSSHKLHNTASAKVLQGLTKTYPVAFSIHQMCYGGEKKSESRPDYAKVHADSSADKKIVWVRTALVEHTLKAIVDEILKNPRYTHYITAVSLHLMSCMSPASTTSRGLLCAILCMLSCLVSYWVSEQSKHSSLVLHYFVFLTVRWTLLSQVHTHEVYRLLSPRPWTHWAGPSNS